MQTAHSFDLANDVLLPEKLEKPIVSFILHNLDFTNEFHVRVYPNPQHRIWIIQILKDILRLMWVVFKFKFIHFELAKVILHLLLNCVDLIVTFTMVHCPFDTAL